MKYVAIITIVALAMALAPLFTIWSLNGLFGLQIPVTFGTWASAFWLGALVYGATNWSGK